MELGVGRGPALAEEGKEENVVAYAINVIDLSTRKPRTPHRRHTEAKQSAIR